MSVMVLPGRNPIVLAKELATLDRLSERSAAPGLRAGRGRPARAAGVRCRARRSRKDVRRGAGGAARLLERPSHSPTTASTSTTTTCRCGPSRCQHHVDVWLGGIAPSELRRVGRLADGWLPSFVTPDDAARGREIIEATCARAPPHHRGRPLRRARARTPTAPCPMQCWPAWPKRRPDLADPSVLIPTGWDALHRHHRPVRRKSAPPSSSSCRSSSLPRLPPGCSTSRKPHPSCSARQT
jgi:hypothetical protein